MVKHKNAARVPLVIALALAALVIACATAPVPITSVVDAHAAIRAAEAVGAHAVPKASLHLKMARDQASEAERLIKEKKNDEARWLLRRAQADADLAFALAKEDESRKRLATAEARVNALAEGEEDELGGGGAP